MAMDFGTPATRLPRQFCLGYAQLLRPTGRKYSWNEDHRRSRRTVRGGPLYGDFLNEQHNGGTRVLSGAPLLMLVGIILVGHPDQLLRSALGCLFAGCSRPSGGQRPVSVYSPPVLLLICRRLVSGDDRDGPLVAASNRGYNGNYLLEGGQQRGREILAQPAGRRVSKISRTHCLVGSQPDETLASTALTMRI